MDMFIDQIKQWLESQLETATEQGGNEILPGVHVEEIDPADDFETLSCILSNGTQLYFTVKYRRFE